MTWQDAEAISTVFGALCKERMTVFWMGKQGWNKARHHAPIHFGLPQRQGESTQHYFIKVLACALMAFVVVTGTKEAFIPGCFSHLQPFICRFAQRSIHTGKRDKRDPWRWTSEITAARLLQGRLVSRRRVLYFWASPTVSIPWHMHPTNAITVDLLAPGSAESWWTPALRCN